MTSGPDADRWRRAEEIFHTAAALPPSSREAFLREACGSDASLREQVDGLLAIAPEAERFLERAGVAMAAIETMAAAGALVGRQLGRYRLVALIGAGGMGEVYRATDVRLGREVAAKILPDALSANPDRLRRFEQEARAAAALNHPNLLAVFDVGSDGGTPYLVSELLTGETLRDALARGALPARRAIDYACQIASGLAAAHEKGIVHRDVKPENVFITTDGRLKVLDFGIAKLTEREGPIAPTSNSTSPGALVGTVGYMSPEQVRGDRVDHRSDVFAFGAVLYEMLTGRRAFEGRTAADTLAAILDDDPPAAEFDDAAAARASQVARRCLEKAPAARFQSCRDVAHVLSDSAGGPASRVRPRVRLGAVAAVAVGLVLAWLWLTGRLPPAARASAIQSVAVLPLDSLSHGPDDDYLADSMTEALITDLAKIRSLRVVSRTSVMRYKRSQKTLPQIGRELNVDAVVEGSIERVGQQVRINAQLIRAATDEHLWAESYDRDLRNILILQDEVARSVAREVRATMTPEEHARLTSAREVAPDAYQAYLKGRYLWDRRTEESVNKSIAYFNEATRIDPGYAAAYSGLADSYLSLGISFDVGSLPPDEAFPYARIAALKALALDPSLAEAHNSLAYTKLVYDWDWRGAEAEFRRSLELNPGYGDGHHWFSHLLVTSGRFDESLAESRAALALDRLSPIINVHLGWNFLFMRRQDDALAQLAKTIELDPNYGLAYWYRGLVYEQRGDYRDAMQDMRRGADLLKSNVVVMGDMGHLSAVSGARRDALRAIADLRQASARRYTSPFEIALIYVGLSETDRAFEWLERAYRDRSDLMVYLRVEPRLDPIRSDPRYEELAHRIGIPK